MNEQVTPIITGPRNGEQAKTKKETVLFNRGNETKKETLVVAVSRCSRLVLIP